MNRGLKKQGSIKHLSLLPIPWRCIYCIPQYSLSENVRLPQASLFGEMDQRPREILFCGTDDTPYPIPQLDFPTPEYTNDINYFKLIISKIVPGQKLV